MDNKKEMKDINEYKEKLSAIYNLSKEMALSLSLDQISKIVLNAAEKVLNFSNIDLFLVNEEKNELHLKECRGLKEPEMDTIIPISGKKGITAHVARTGKSLNISDVRKDERYLFGLEGSRSELCVPIKIKDKVIGVLDAESKELNAFSEEDQRLLENLASQAAIAIENAKLFTELSSLKEFNESIVNSLNEGIWVEDEKGFCTYANPKIRKMLGYESLVGKHWKEIIVPEKISRMEEETKTRRYGRRSSYETVLLTNSGERIPVIVSAAPLFEEGKFIGTMGVFVDIREQKKIEESLKKSERLYRSLSEFNKKLLENSPVGIMNINKEMKVEYENPEMRRILGLPFGRELDTMGMDIREIPLIKENEISSIFDELRKGKEISKEISSISVSGERIYLSLKGVSLFKGFKFVGAIVIVNDITERKRLEQQREKSRKEAEFYADV
ncbi:MAG TPA: PAS domain S-box protein, partial [Methanomicrobia archaeon]|nr:PAS domain S-box protein [Methanomicrobia archaeon]